MDRCSYFIEDICLFGSYPTQDSVRELESNKVKYFIDLTYPTEKKITPYETKYTYISYPINDHNVPTNMHTFSKFILKIARIIKEECSIDSKMYLHCKGGHGRSGVVVSILLCYLNNISPEESLKKTAQAHCKRENMKEKWRRMGSPQTMQQKNFVFHFCKAIYFFNDTKMNDTYNLFSTMLTRNISTELGDFSTLEAAYQAYKDPTNEKYVRELKQTNTGKEAIELGEKIITDYNWEINKKNIMYKLLKIKFTSNNYMKSNLLNTRLCVLINKSEDLFWGKNYINNGLNNLGKLLMKVRNDIILEN